MQFGNWALTESTIEWRGQGFNRFVIDRQQLLETEIIQPLQEELYKWIVAATNEEWLTDDDLYDLNFAFVFVAGVSGQDFDYEIFDATLEFQYNMLDGEEESEP